MKAVLSILPLAALASAFVVPEENVFAQIPLEEAKPQPSALWDKLPSLDELTHRLSKPFKHDAESVPRTLDQAIAHAHHDEDDISERNSPLEYSSWIEDALKRLESDEPHGPPHHGPPGHKHPPPHHGPPDHKHPPGKGKKPHKGKRPHWLPKWPGHKKHHHHHHGPPNQTIYELISKSNHTTKLAKLISGDKDLVKLLNGTKANYTIFAPTDYAFSKLPKHGNHTPPAAFIKKVLLYHVLPDLYPSWKLLFAHTAPTLLEPESLGGHPQRVLVKWLGLLRGVRVNYYDRIVAANIVSVEILHSFNISF
jgi:hypothetical protein